MVCLTAQSQGEYSSGQSTFYKRDGVYYIYSPDLGGELPLHEYGLILEEKYNTFGVDVALAFEYSISANPHNDELLRVFGPWGVVDHYERRIDGKTNPWEI